MIKHIVVIFLLLGAVFSNIFLAKTVTALVMDNIDNLERKPQTNKNVQANENPGNTKDKSDQAKSNKGGVISGEKPANIPEFPSDEADIETQILFDDGFSNYVDPMFQSGEKWDIFVDQIDQPM